MKPGELAALLIVGRVLGFVIEPYDLAGRRGAVDGLGVRPDGKTVAVEVTTAAGEDRPQLESLLAHCDFKLHNPGRWCWTVTVAGPRDIPELLRRYASIITKLEALGVAMAPDWRSDTDDDDLRWLNCSGCEFHGHPDLPTAERYRDVAVLPSGAGGTVDTELTGLRSALAALFTERHIPGKFTKLLAHGADESHLYIGLDYTALPFPVSDALAHSDMLPSEPPPLPAGVGHLWLAPRFSRRVLYWSPAGWSVHHPYSD